MASPDWGPFPGLAAVLRLHRREPPFDWIGRLNRTGAPWLHFARGPRPDFWPPNLPGLVPLERPRLKRWWWWRFGRPTAVDPAPLAALLPACHAWVAAENARYLAPWLSPDPNLALGPAFFETSSCALIWSLAAVAASGDPAALLAEGASLERAAPLDTATFGDLLTLHRNVETLADFWLGGATRQPEQKPRWRAGGLRRQSMLEAFATL